MALERTLSILKPSVNNLSARIFVRAAGLDFEELDVWGKKGTPEFLAKDPADLTPLLEEDGGPVIIMVLEGESAVAKNREVMGATNPANAAEGTIRKLYAKSIEANSVHGSDSPENARIEIAYFFPLTELVRYDWKK